jgi:hypothetical protein
MAATTSRPIDLPLHVRIGIVLAGVVVAILLKGLMRRQLLEPYAVIVVQAGFVVIDKHRGRNMHGIDQRQSFPNTTLTECTPLPVT